jgi:hypothetical protein
MRNFVREQKKQKARAGTGAAVSKGSNTTVSRFLYLSRTT